MHDLSMGSTNAIHMKNATTLLFGFVLCHVANAALPPFATAPLNDHLREVNAQWVKQDPAPDGGAAPAAFARESDRIRTHLLMVRERLMARDTHGRTADQRLHRAHLLNRLGAYADGRRFPQNLAVAERNPVFIDAFGTACAVGWLMIESGHAGLAGSIRDGSNLGYIHGIIADPRFAEPVAAWAEAHGFTPDELAWIQPGYPPVLPWQPFGGGTDGEVRVMHELANGNLLVAGEFTAAGGAPASRVAVWNGSAFVPLGDGVQGIVNCAVEHDGDLYLGGAMLEGGSDLAVWDGAAWSYQTVFEGKYAVIKALHVHEGVLHAAGSILGFAGQDDRVQRLVAGLWEPVGGVLNAAIHDLDTHEGVLVAAGEFTALESDPGASLLHVASLNGDEWQPLAGGLDGTVHDLLVYDGALYAGGALFNNIAPAFGLARLTSGANAWEPLMPNLPQYIYETVGPPRILRLARHDGSIYFGGVFGISSSIMLFGYNIGRWDGIDQVAELTIPDGAVNAVHVKDDRLVIGGAFSAWQPHLAVLDLTLGVPPVHSGPALVASPNPTGGTLRITGAEDLSAAHVRVTDAAGREMAIGIARLADGLLLDAAGLPPGSYQVHLQTPGAMRTMRFVRT